MINKMVESAPRAGMVIIKGIVISFILTLISVFIFSIVLTYTNTPESTIFPVIAFITAISILIGSSVSTIKINKRGIINGGAIGLIYILILYLLSSIITTGFMVNLNTIILIAAATLAGMLGGIVGVNIK